MFKTFERLQLVPFVLYEADHTNCIACLIQHNRLKSKSIICSECCLCICLTYSVVFFFFSAILWYLFFIKYKALGSPSEDKPLKLSWPCSSQPQTSAPDFLLLMARVYLVDEREGTVPPGWWMLASAPPSVLLWVEGEHHWGDHLSLVLAAFGVCACMKLRSFSCVQLFAALWTIACQAPLSMGFPRQEY